MTTIHVRLPDGRSSDEVGGVLSALDDESAWDDPSTEMYISIRRESAHSMLTIIRRRGAGVCLICKEPEDEAPGYTSTGGTEEGILVVELQDVTVRYPARFFIDVRLARQAVATFLTTERRDAAVTWEKLNQADLQFVEFDPSE